MRYLIIFAALLMLTIASCGEETNPGMKTLKVFASASIAEDSPFVTSGDNLVFHLYRVAPDEQNIADDEFAEDLYLEITPENGEFVFDSNTMAIYDLPFRYRQYCFCGPANRYSLKNLNFSGEEVSNGNWRVTGSVTVTLEYVDEKTEEVQFSFDREIEVSGTYRLESF